MMRETRGQMDRRVAIAMHAMRDASKDWRKRSRQDSMEFWNAVEEGRIAGLSQRTRRSPSYSATHSTRCARKFRT